jgi:glycosyltransferase involved in cell wall biosynthesis
MVKKISVIIPTFNSAKELTKCLESFKAQTISNENYEVMVIDDGSNEGTKDAATKYPVRYIYQQNQGPAEANVEELYLKVYY